MTRSGPCAAALSLVALTGCGTVDQPNPVPVDIDFRPAVACAAQVKVPQIVMTSPAVFPDAVWEEPAAWEAQMRFRLDDAGVPVAVRATVRGSVDSDAREKAAVAALERHRFCRPVDLSTQTDWLARLYFVAAPLSDKFGGGRMIVQQFLPAYSRAEVSAGRVGKNAVRGTFGPDGHPITVRLAASSGDDVLDRKSLEAMASYQLVFRPGTILTEPVTLEQPYTYEIH